MIVAVACDHAGFALKATVLPAAGETAAGRMMSLVDELAAARTDAPVPDPAAAWLVNLVTAFEELRRGAMDRDTFSARLYQLACEASERGHPVPEGIEGAGLAEFLLRVIVWADWPPGATRNRLAALRLVRSLLPPSHRPPWRTIFGTARTVLAQQRRNVAEAFKEAV